jgi:metallopeptidase MepB
MTRKPPQSPLKFDIEPSFFPQEANDIICTSDKVWNAVAAIPPSEATFATTILPIIRDENSKSARARFLSWMKSISTSKEIRDASYEFYETLSVDSNARWSRRDIFAVVDAVWNKQEDLDPESQLYLDTMRRDFISSGLGLEDARATARIQEIQDKLPVLTTQYIKNLDQDKGGTWFTVDELEGIPETTLKSWKAEGDKRFVDRRLPNITAVYNSAENGQTRKQAWLDHENRVAQTNPEILKQFLELRDEKARLLGLPNWAVYREKDRFVSTADAFAYLESMRGILSDLGQRDVQAMLKEKANHLEKQGGAAAKEDDVNRLFHWDRSFYRRRLINKEFDLDPEKVAEYFPLWGSLDRLLQIFEAVFSIKFQKYPDTSPDIQVWHEDVKAYAVWNAEEHDDGFLGYLYLDPFPRENKYGHKGHFAIQNVRSNRKICYAT